MTEWLGLVLRRVRVGMLGAPLLEIKANPWLRASELTCFAAATAKHILS